MKRLRPFGWGALAVALGATLGVPRPAAAASPPARVSVLTMGPGEHPFTRFGHNAILLEWDEPGQRPNLVYNFGTFELDGLRGVEDFMAGRFRYWLSVSTLEQTLKAYGRDQRSLTAQQLSLTPPEREELAAALAQNALPEQRYYDYDYYRDNCSTRVRDALDKVLGGQLAEQIKGRPGRLTFRQHTLRLVGDTPWLYAGLDLALGTPTDRPTTRWEELFLPQELHDALARAKRGPGTSPPLVAGERRLLEGERTAPLEPPERRPAFALAGLALGGTLLGLGRAARRHVAWRVLFGSLTALLGTALGLLGCAFTFFWFFSKHWAAHRNLSILLAPPWALGLAVVGAFLALGRTGSRRLATRWLSALVATSVAALLVALMVNMLHEAQRLALLLLPLWAGLLLGVRDTPRE